MNEYLEWLTAGLIFLWILGAHDVRAAPVDLGNVRCESPSQNASLPAGEAFSSNGEVHAPNGFALRRGHHAASSWAGNESGN